MARWLITGASGQLGGRLLQALFARPGASVLALCGSREPLPGAAVARVPLDDAEALRRTVRDFAPDFVIHTAAMTAVSDAFARPDDARRQNTLATRILAESATAGGARFLFTSTDMVFDGAQAPYTEEAAPTPLSVYGRTKADAERAIADLPGTLTVRIPLLFGVPATPRPSTFANQLAALRENREQTLFTDEFRTPMWNRDAADALIRLAESDVTGLLHVCGPQRLSRLEMIAAVARAMGISNPAIRPISRLDLAGPEPRPADLSLRAERFARLFPDFAPAAVSDPRSWS
ncbi:MAG: SDR family oxidoreductase [Phycisphaerales bacterium]|nr:SDR family oxidoreductase [Phycisphaerales bacterium]